jgi:hypothetical protein
MSRSNCSLCSRPCTRHRTRPCSCPDDLHWPAVSIDRPCAHRTVVVLNCRNCSPAVVLPPVLVLFRTRPALVRPLDLLDTGSRCPTHVRPPVELDRTVDRTSNHEVESSNECSVDRSRTSRRCCTDDSDEPADCIDRSGLERRSRRPDDFDPTGPRTDSHCRHVRAIDCDRTTHPRSIGHCRTLGPDCCTIVDCCRTADRSALRLRPDVGIEGHCRTCFDR